MISYAYCSILFPVIHGSFIMRSPYGLERRSHKIPSEIWDAQAKIIEELQKQQRRHRQTVVAESGASMAEKDQKASWKSWKLKNKVGVDVVAGMSSQDFGSRTSCRFSMFFLSLDVTGVFILVSWCQSRSYVRRWRQRRWCIEAGNFWSYLGHMSYCVIVLVLTFGDEAKMMLLLWSRLIKNPTSNLSLGALNCSCGFNCYCHINHES